MGQNQTAIAKRKRRRLYLKRLKQRLREQIAKAKKKK